MDAKTMIRILLTPSCWLRNEGTNHILSEFVNERLDAGELPVSTTRYTAKLGNVVFWTANFPYAFGTVQSGPVHGMPDRATVFRLSDALCRAAMPQEPQ